MVLRPESLRQRLLRLEDVVTQLSQLPLDFATGTEVDVPSAWAVERGLQLAAEIVLDVGNHILSAHFGVSAKDHEDVLHRLGEVGLLGDDLAARLKGLGGFRNLLVHDYLELDRRQVADLARRAPRDFSDFALTVRRWLEGLGG